MRYKDYYYAKKYTDSTKFTPQEDGVYFYGKSVDARAQLPDAIRKRCFNNTEFVEIIEDSRSDMLIEAATGAEYSEHSEDELKRFLMPCIRDNVYLDVTGISLRACAPLVKCLLKMKATYKSLNIVYVEPVDYNIDIFHSESVTQNLAERINGLNPLPQFISIVPERYGREKLIVFLGFEGGRFSFIVEETQIASDVVPIIGLPGYRAEYPFITYHGNQSALMRTESWRSVIFIPANSIPAAFNFLENECKKDQKNRLVIAPIGTKPHAVATVLAAIKFPRQIEIVYDNPEQTKKKSDGIGAVTVTSVFDLIGE